MKFSITLTPITRYSMTLDRESEIEKGTVFNEEMFKNYIQERARSEEKRDKMFVSLFIIDAILAFLIMGSHVNVPYTNIDTSKIPAILEIITAMSAFCLLIAAVSFNNFIVYDHIVFWFSRKKSGNGVVDPDFTTASVANFDFFAKTFRKNFHVSGVDFFEPNRRFSFWIIVLNFSVAITFLIFPILHLILNYISLTITFQNNSFSFGYAFYYIMIFVSSFAAILTALIPWIGFTFIADTDTQAIVRKRINPEGNALHSGAEV